MQNLVNGIMRKTVLECWLKINETFMKNNETFMNINVKIVKFMEN